MLTPGWASCATRWAGSTSSAAAARRSERRGPLLTDYAVKGSPPFIAAWRGKVGSVPMESRTGLPVVGMVGGGQLARMTHQAAISLGQSLRVLALTPDDGAALVVPAVHIGRHDDLGALREFAKGCDVVTFDHEHVPGE